MSISRELWSRLRRTALCPRSCTLLPNVGSCQNVVATAIWLVKKGDLCQTCRFRPQCPDQLRCLHYVAGAGNLVAHPQDLTPIENAFRRFPLGVPKIGAVAATGKPLLLPVLDGGGDWVADGDWFRSEGVASFAAYPLVFRDEVLGVLAVFDRGALNESDFVVMGTLANHAAVSIANANAFEEIAFLKERLEEENSYLREEVTAASGGGGDLIGESPALRDVLRQIELVAASDATVLITGESGTGKELVARAIHFGSAPSKGPFVPVNCAAVPKELSERALRPRERRVHGGTPTEG